MLRKKIIIADDDSVFAKLLMYEFERRNMDMDIQTAEDGSQALVCVRTRQPDLLLLDLRMPKEDGFSVLQQVREQGMVFPIIVLTHFRDIESMDRCQQLGSTDFVVKGEMTMNQLADKIMVHLN